MAWAFSAALVVGIIVAMAEILVAVAVVCVLFLIGASIWTTVRRSRRGREHTRPGPESLVERAPPTRTFDSVEQLRALCKRSLDGEVSSEEFQEKMRDLVVGAKLRGITDELEAQAEVLEGYTAEIEARKSPGPQKMVPKPDSSRRHAILGSQLLPPPPRPDLG